MIAARTVKALHPARRDDIAGLLTRRPLPAPGLEHLDPFLFLNHHGPQLYPPRNRGLPFGPHPHRGFETITFILDGELAHRDFHGHESIIRAGGVQWMTAGRGIVHSELSPSSFLERGGSLEILQLWVNLPARLKLIEPRYIGLQREDIPELPILGGGGAIQLIAGRQGDAEAPIASLTGLHMTTVALDPGAHVRLDAPSDREVLLYVVRGQVVIGGAPVTPFHLAQLRRDGDEVELVAKQETVLLFGHADPHHEPIVSYGPFVMNSRDEIVQAIREYEAGAFYRPARPRGRAS